MSKKRANEELTQSADLKELKTFWDFQEVEPYRSILSIDQKKKVLTQRANSNSQIKEQHLRVNSNHQIKESTQTVK